MITYEQLLPWRAIARAIVRLGRPEWPLLATLVVTGLLISVFEGVGLTFGLVLVYRLIGAEPDAAGSGIVGTLLTIIGQQDTATLLGVGITMLVAFAALGEGTTILGELIATRVTRRAREQVYAAYLECTYEQATSRGQSTLLDTLDYEVPTFTSVLLELSGLIGQVTALIAFAAYFTALSPAVSAVIALSGLVLLGIVGLSSGRLGERGRRIGAFNERLIAHTVATAQAMRTIRLHSAEPRFIAAYRSAAGAVAGATVGMAWTNALAGSLYWSCRLAALGLIIWVIVATQVPVETALLIFALMLKAAPHLSTINHSLVGLFNSHLALSVVCASLDRERLPLPSSGTRAFTGLKREIRFEDVRFAHEAGDEVLAGVSFSLPAGEVTTLIGPSGAGKTTLINLLARLYEPQQGRILADGVPIEEYDRPSWLGRIGFCGQDIDLQDGTILDNVRFFDPAISEAQVRDALAIAQIGDFTDGLPRRLLTPVGERGLRLSGGQRQRIGLARAIARNPDLLILDEATNAVDIQLETRIYRAIRTALPRATLLVITHRTALDGVQQLLLIDGRIERVQIDA